MTLLKNNVCASEIFLSYALQLVKLKLPIKIAVLDVQSSGYYAGVRFLPTKHTLDVSVTDPSWQISIYMT